MFHEVDAALVALIKDEALGEAGVDVALDVPNRPWFAAVQRPTVNLFLYDVRENVARRDVMFEPVLDDSGRIVGRRAPAARYDVHYLLSVWGVPDPALEHRLMAALLVGIGRHDVFPEARVPEEHRELGLWHLSVASGPKRMMPGNFGGEMKLQAEVCVTVPLPPRVPLPVGPPVDRPLDIRMSGAGGQREQVQGRPAPTAGAAGPGGVPRQAAGPAAPAGAATDPARQRDQLAQAVARGAAPGASGPPRPGAGRPAGPPGAGGPPARPGDPMALLRQALAQAAQAQAALAQAQAVVAQAMARAGGPAGAARPAAQGQAAQGQGAQSQGAQSQAAQGQAAQGQAAQGQAAQGQAAQRPGAAPRRPSQDGPPPGTGPTSTS